MDKGQANSDSQPAEMQGYLINMPNWSICLRGVETVTTATVFTTAKGLIALPPFIHSSLLYLTERAVKEP